MKKQIWLILMILGSLALKMAGQDYNIVRPSIHGPDGISINSYSGNLFYERQDLFLPGRGLDVAIRFTYNSERREKDWGFGRGWTHTYNMTYAMDTSGIWIERQDGRRDLFILEDTEFQAPIGVFDRLEEYESGKFRLSRKNGTTYFFEDAEHKKLTKIADRNDNAITFAYTDSLLTLLTDASGRTISFSWTDGKLTDIVTNTDPQRTVHYEYDEDGNPIEVINPLGGSIEYQYDNESKLTTVIDENGNPVNIAYNEITAVIKLITCISTKNLVYDYTNRKTHVIERVSGISRITSYEYGEDGRLQSQKGNCCGFHVSFEYDEFNNVTKRIDANGNAELYVYDQNGNVLQLIDPLGHFEQFSYHPDFQEVTSHTDHNGNLTNYSYDPNGNLIQIDHPTGISESFTYDGFGNRLTHTDENSNLTSFSYDSHGNLMNVDHPNGGATSYTYDELGNLLTTTTPNSHTFSFEYDALERQVKAIDPLGHEEIYEYDPKGNLLAYTDKNGNLTSYEFDALDRMTAEIDAFNERQEMAYDEAGNLVKLKDKLGFVTRHSYSNLNQLRSTTDPSGEETNYEHDANGNTVSSTLPNENTVVWSYDKKDRMIEIRDDLGLIIEYEYDPNGNLIRETDGNNHSVEYQYDQLNRLTAVTDPTGNSIELSYDAAGNLISKTDRNGNAYTYSYNAMNVPVSVTDPLGQVTLMSYDLQGNLISVEDPNGHLTSYSYDALDRPTLETLADGSSTVIEYDANGNILSKTDNNGATVTYSFDLLNQLTGISYPGGNDRSFQFNANGLMVLASNNDATVVYEYDPAGRLTLETLNGKITEYVRNTKDRLLTINYPGGSSVSEQYDQRDRLLSVSRNEVTLAEFAYDSGNRLTFSNYPNNTYSEFQYDVNNQISQITGAFHNLRYAYDDDGNKLTAEDLNQQDRSERYFYDQNKKLTGFKKGQLIGMDIPSPESELSYSLDPLGNRTSSSDGATNTTYTNNNLNQYTAISGTDLQYDGNGNLIFDGQFTFQFDEANQLTAVDNGTAANYKYDPFGRRIAKITPQGEERYYYSGNRIIEQYNGQNELEKTFFYGRWLDELVVMNNNDTDYYYHYNALGSVIALSDESGTLVESYDYLPYGDFQIYDQNDAPIAASQVGNDRLFTGREFDEESGLFYYRNRYYHPQIGRFIQRDPRRYEDGLNWYEYVKSRPTSLVDPFGTLSVCPITPDPPGDCEEDEHRNLQNQVKEACDRSGKRSCKDKNLSIAEISRRIQRNIRCSAARDRINARCFRGGDSNHRDEHRKANDNLQECRRRLAEETSKQQQETKEFDNTNQIIQNSLIAAIILGKLAQILFSPIHVPVF